MNRRRRRAELRLARIDAALHELDAEATIADEHVDRYSIGELTELGGVRRAVTYIRERADHHVGKGNAA